MSEVRTRSGVHDYPINFSDATVGPAQSLKLLIYIPGYRVITAEFNETDIQRGRVFVPPLVPLATTAFRGRLVAPNQRPLAGQTLRLDYFLREVMSYFGYFDGSVPSLSIGDFTTDTRGEFMINVPAVVDDPFFGSGQFHLSAGNQRSFLGSQHLKPNRFTAQKVYEPIVITNIGRGTLSGTLGKETLKRNNLSEELRTYVRPRDTIVTGIALQARQEGVAYNADLQIDGSFEVELPSGEYELVLWAPQLNEGVSIQRGLIVEPDKRRVLHIP